MVLVHAFSPTLCMTNEKPRIILSKIKITDLIYIVYAFQKRHFKILTLLQFVFKQKRARPAEVQQFF